MTYQTRYNTKQCQVLLQVFIYLLDSHQITFEEFNELTGENNATFTRAMQQFKQMIKSLKMEMELSKGYSKSEEVHFESLIYVLDFSDNPYNIDYNNLKQVDPEELIAYSMVIVYCMLKNRKKVTNLKLAKILPNFDRHVATKMFDYMLDLISEDLEKNELKSYMLIEE